ncbi:MAG TPA: hypothetical protein VFK57_15750 [Vicinamibacterales bacterium]|nr:hypothetical protein [Vicinamibacterales bacterium]
MPPSKAGAPRTPRDWKVLNGRAFCPSCKHDAYSLRAVILPVSRPDGRSWDDLRAELRTLWGETTRCANWLMSEFYARDLRRGALDETLGPMPQIYLYPEARLLFPGLPPQSLSALIQTVRKKYRAQRHAVLWTRAASLASYRFPAPLMLPPQAWSLCEHEGSWTVDVRLRDARWTLKLRGGAPMRRQTERLRQIVRGEASRGSLTIYHSTGGSAPQVMIKIAVWLPKPPAVSHGTVAVVRTDERALLTTEPMWRIDPGPVRNVLAADARRRTALLTNLQAARRSHSQTDGIERALAELAGRTRRRLAEACRMYAAQLATHVAGRGARAVEYDDSVRPALDHFPWSQLRTRIGEQLEKRGIRLVATAGGENAA